MSGRGMHVFFHVTDDELERVLSDKDYAPGVYSDFYLMYALAGDLRNNERLVKAQRAALRKMYRRKLKDMDAQGFPACLRSGRIPEGVEDALHIPPERRA